MRRTYLEWNLNQATNRFRKNIIPDFVLKEIEEQDKDLVVLVEYADTCCNSNEFKNKLENLGYTIKVNANNNSVHQNDVLIAWKKEFFADEGIFDPPAEGDYPEMLAVKLKDRIDDTSFVIVGVRIRLCNDYKTSVETAWRKRASQLQRLLRSVYKRFGNEIIICLGDFNNNRCDLNNCVDKPFVNLWSLKVIDDIARKYGLIRITPIKGSSIGQENGSIPFKDDHLLVSQNPKIKPDENHYCREFTKKNPEIYLHGSDFKVYDSQINETTWEIPFGSGIPDHTILCGAVNINNSKEELILSNYFSNGGETYTREELILRLFCDIGLEGSEAEDLIDYAVSMNWISKVGKDCYTK